jgi:endonuclease/exonuclease/phosphatase family metal-dependent hydrolase
MPVVNVPLPAPRRASATATAPHAALVRVVTYNIHRAIGVDLRRDPARIAAVIAELHADVIGLQEVDWHDDPDAGEPQFEYLAHLSGYRAVVGPNLRDHRGHYGNVLLTRLPIIATRLVDLSHSAREPRNAIDVTLELGTASLRVIVTHLGLALHERRVQAAQLRDLLLEQQDRPTMVLGDLNDWLPGSPTLRCVSGLCPPMARPPSYPSPCPVLALDRVLAYGFDVAPRVTTHRSRLARWASDHLPVVADVEVAALRPFAHGLRAAGFEVGES